MNILETASEKRRCVTFASNTIMTDMMNLTQMGRDLIQLLIEKEHENRATLFEHASRFVDSVVDEQAKLEDQAEIKALDKALDRAMKEALMWAESNNKPNLVDAVDYIYDPEYCDEH